VLPTAALALGQGMLIKTGAALILVHAHAGDDPVEIGAFFGRDVHGEADGIGDRRRFGAGEKPAMGFGVAVGEGEAGRAIVIRGWEIDPPSVAVGIGVVGLVEKIAVVDAVGVFVEEDKNARGFRHLQGAEELDVIRIVLIDAAPGDVPRIADHRVHGIAAEAASGPTGFHLVGAEDVVGGALVNAERFAGVIGEAGFGDGCSVGIIWIVG